MTLSLFCLRFNRNNVLKLENVNFDGKYAVVNDESRPGYLDFPIEVNYYSFYKLEGVCRDVEISILDEEGRFLKVIGEEFLFIAAEEKYEVEKFHLPTTLKLQKGIFRVYLRENSFFKEINLYFSHSFLDLDKFGFIFLKRYFTDEYRILENKIFASKEGENYYNSIKEGFKFLRLNIYKDGGKKDYVIKGNKIYVKEKGIYSLEYFVSPDVQFVTNEKVVPNYFPFIGIHLKESKVYQFFEGKSLFHDSSWFREDIVFYLTIISLDLGHVEQILEKILKKTNCIVIDENICFGLFFLSKECKRIVNKNPIKEKKIVAEDIMEGIQIPFKVCRY